MTKKGFTLMEILVVILIIAVVIAFFNISYRSARIVRTNERARAMFVELTNAARLFNDTYPTTKIYGGFGNADAQNLGYLDPCKLFLGAIDDAEVQDNIASYALRFRDWGLDTPGDCNANLRYEGYTFILCNPDFDTDDTKQPHANCIVDGVPRFAVMITPDSVTFAKYSGRHAWMTSGYELANNYN